MSGDAASEMWKFVAPEFVFGAGARRLLGRYVRNLGMTRPLLVSDAGVVAAGWVADVTAILEEEDIIVELFTAVSPNPRDTEVAAGAELYRRVGCNSLVAIGGGSPIDCAKAIGIVVANGGAPLDYKGVDTVALPIPPLVCLPTTAGTAADISQFAIINDSVGRCKYGVISRMIIPDAALIDPETTVTLDPFLTACTGFDAFSHAVEAYASNASSPVTDLHAEAAVRLLRDHLGAAVRQPIPLAREKVMLASLEAGLAFSNASLGLCHALAHSVGGRFDLQHGFCNALLLGRTVVHNFSAAPEKYARLAALLGVASPDPADPGLGERLAVWIEDFRCGLGLAGGLAGAGVRREMLPELAALAEADACLLTNPRDFSRAELEVIYAEAL